MVFLHFVFYNTSIRSAPIMDVFQICEALINSYLIDFVVSICLTLESSLVHLAYEIFL